MNHQTVCNGPAWNKETNEVVEINLLEEVKEEVITQRFLLFFNRKTTIEKCNEKYIPYFVSKMFIEDKNISIHKWGIKKYNSTKNYCPKCRTFNLIFQKEFHFD